MANKPSAAAEKTMDIILWRHAEAEERHDPMRSAS